MFPAGGAIRSGRLGRAGAAARREAVQPQLRRPGDPHVLRAAPRACAAAHLRLPAARGRRHHQTG